MNRPHVSIVTLSGLVLLSVGACDRGGEPGAPPPEPEAAIAEPAPVAATYVCDSGLTVSVAYPDPQSAQVSYRDRIYVLRGAEAGSGTRYRDAEMEWRSVTREGLEEATLSRIVEGDAAIVVERCSRPAPAMVVPSTGPQLTPVDGTPSPEPCKGPQLRLTPEGGDAGAGNRVSIVGVRNVGAQACSLEGYPTVGLLDRQGRELTAIRAEQSPANQFRTNPSPTRLLLAPRTQAFFDIAWTVVPDQSQGQSTCPDVSRIRVTAPGDTSPVSLDQALSPCGGRIRVSPFRLVAEDTASPGPAT